MLYKINGHGIAFSLPKRNIVKRRNFRAKLCLISFTSIFPLALSMDTASRINGQQQDRDWPTDLHLLARP